MLQGENCKIEKQFLSKIKTYIAQHNVVRATGHYLVALSGGADSVALLLTMQDMGFHIEAAHCNFHLRGEESDRDEQFCKDLCERRGVSLHLAHFDTRGYAALHHVSIEMAARSLRYSYFQNLCKDLSLDGICVAHHRDDSVETVILNLVRGTGVHGLRGILPVNGNVLRPLLCVSREDIINYLGCKNQNYVTDSTNLVADVMRNKIRLQILPLLQELNPDVKTTIAKAAEHVTEACKILDHSIDEALTNGLEANGLEANDLETNGFDVERLLSFPSPEYLLYTMLKRYGFQPSQINEVYRSITSQKKDGTKEWQSEDYSMALTRGRILIEKREEKAFKPIKLPEAGTYVLNQENDKLKIEQIERDSTFSLSKQADCVCLDAQNVLFPLTVRRYVAGDKFVPFGMKGFKLISDYLTDKKKNVFEKRRQLVVSDAEGKIVWLVNERVDDRCKVTNDTDSVLRLSFVLNQ